MSSASILLQIGSKKIEKVKYELRRSQISGVKGGIPRETEDYVEFINACITKAMEELHQGISGLTCVDTFCSQLEAQKEKGADMDSNISSASDSLGSEISDCNTKINELETEISNLYTAYYNALEEEAEAARRAAQRALEIANKII